MLIQFLKRIIRVIKTQGIIEALSRTAQRILAVPAALIIVVLWPFKKIRLIRLISSRIGHFAENVHLSLCALKYNSYPEEKNCLHLFYTQTHVPVCNQFLWEKWSKVIKIVPPWGAFWGYVDTILIYIHLL